MEIFTLLLQEKSHTLWFQFTIKMEIDWKIFKFLKCQPMFVSGVKKESLFLLRRGLQFIRYKCGLQVIELIGKIIISKFYIFPFVFLAVLLSESAPGTTLCEIFYNRLIATLTFLLHFPGTLLSSRILSSLVF